MSAEKLLVLGGAGYVGSHFVHHARSEGYEIHVVDNLSTGHEAAVKDALLFTVDVTDKFALRGILGKNRYKAVFHFAGACLVSESVEDPAKYYHNNVFSAYHILESMRATDHDRIVFSSSSAVYGLPEKLPLTEDHPKNPISPYGRTKLAIEWLLEDYHKAYGINYATLRYFNAAGCEPQFGLGEDHNPETHLIPNIVRHAILPESPLTIFGKDYPTADGTCIRDYIHVADLAEAHLKSMERLDNHPAITLNLGTGQGVSNLQVVEAVSRKCGRSLDPEIGPRRPGDPPELVADASKAYDLLSWKPSRSDLDTIVESVLKWMQENPTGYED